jgi:stage II sporulation protein D
VVRVGVAVDTGAVTVTATGGFTLNGPDGGVLAESGPADSWTARAEGPGAGMILADGTRTVAVSGPVVIRTTGEGRLAVGGTAYRGEILIRRGAAGVSAVNLIDLEAYLLGVVAREIGRRPPAELEAVKAQAVAARTYAIGNLGGREPLGFDFFGTDRDQVYGGVIAEDSVATRAVEETRGEILTWEGVPILAYYSSTCGGRTADIEESWPWRAPLPYLRSVSDEIPGTGTYYCSTSNRFRWSAQWTREELRSALGRSLRAHTGGRVEAVRAVERLTLTNTGPSGRRSLRLDADGRSYDLRADSVRWVLRTPAGAGLNSSRIDELDATLENGDVASLSIRGGGWGHGIGMCQVGAMGRARAGQTYRQILQAYYTGTRIERLY